jgi:hypothetical protein
MPKFSGVRKEEYELYKALYESRAINRFAYSDVLADLRKKEEQYRKRALRVRNATLVRQAARREAAEARRIPVAIDYVKPAGEDIPNEEIELAFIRASRKLVGRKHAVITISVNGELVQSELLTIIGDNPTRIYYETVRPKLIHFGSDFQYNYFYGEVKLDEEGHTTRDISRRVRVVIALADEVPARNILQNYRDGVVDHCVLDSLISEWSTYAEHAVTPGSKTRLRQIVKKLNVYKTIYSHGVPHNDMEMIAKCISRCIVLNNVIGGTVTKFNKRSSKEFHFSNTRKNHVEPGKLVLNREFMHVTAEELNKIIEEHQKDDVFYHIAGDMMNGKPHAIKSLRGCWAVVGEDYTRFKEFSNLHKIHERKVDAIAYPELNAFLRESRLINSAPTPLCENPNDLEGVTHIDIEKAYTQHAKAPIYRGFPGAIRRWCKLSVGVEFLKDHVGCYQYKVLATVPLLEMFGIKAGSVYSSPSVEIEYFVSLGCQVEIIAGAFGSTFDIEYTSDMLCNKRYALWAGKLGSDREYDTYTFPGDRDWAGHLKAQLGDDRVFYFSELGLIVIKVKSKSNKTNHHILAFITAYTRMNMLEIIRQIPMSNLVKVVLDGVYFRGVMPTLNVPVKVKEMVVHNGFRDAWYYPSEIDTSSWPVYSSRFEIPNGFVSNAIVLSGAGGTGKSHSVLTDKSFTKILYVVPAHVLGQKCKETYGVQYTTIHSLIGVGCQAYKNIYGSPSIAFIDELTMIDKEWVATALEMYPDTFFFLAGDIDSKQWFQCRNGAPGKFSNVWIPSADYFVVEYLTDYRAKGCPALQKLKQDVRSEMKRVFTDGNAIDVLMMNQFIRKTCTLTPFNKAVEMFKTGDIWIAGTHKTNEILLKCGVVSGCFNERKEIVQDGREKRGSFTIHSFQGLTIASGKIFISLDMFEYAMLYTAISRAVSIEQIVFV